MQKRPRRKVSGRAERRNAKRLTMFEARSAVQDAEQLRLEGKFEKAQGICLSVLKQFPDFTAALHTLGLTLADRAQYDKALGYLHRASMLNPYDANTLTALAGVYLRLSFHQMAARTLEQALRQAPDNAAIHLTLGEIYREEKEYELAVTAYEKALELDPTFAVAEIGLGMCAMHIGELNRAATVFNKAVANGSRSTGILYMLSQLPPDLVNLDLISLLDEAISPSNANLEDDFRSQTAFAKAAALDKAGRWEEAWMEICTMRRADSGDSRNKYGEQKERFEALLKLSSRAPFTPKIQADVSSDLPISLFIIGPSRSGKTTLERLIGSLDDVKRGYENPIVENAVRRAFQAAGFPTRSRLVELPPDLSTLFTDFYNEELLERAGSAKVLTNTLPGRNEDALRIASDLQNTRFIFVKRNIDELILRIYMRNYKSGNEWASDVRDIKDYVIWCHEMMDVMASRMPDMARILTYEDIVTNPSGALAEMASLCGLNFNNEKVPTIGNDVGCAEPYVNFLQEVLSKSHSA